MPFQWKTVMIEGEPGTDVTIYTRDRGEEEPPPPVFEGATNSKGRLKLILPPDDFAVVNSMGGTLPLQLEGGPDSVTLRLTAN